MAIVKPPASCLAFQKRITDFATPDFIPVTCKLAHPAPSSSQKVPVSKLQLQQLFFNKGLYIVQLVLASLMTQSAAHHH